MQPQAAYDINNLDNLLRRVGDPRARLSQEPQSIEEDRSEVVPVTHPWAQPAPPKEVTQ